MAMNPEQRADALYKWLIERPPGALPRLAAIAAALREMETVAAVSDAFRLLVRQGRIEQRHGTLRLARGHRLVRIVATGALLQTAGCPLTFDSPPNFASHQIGDATMQLVLHVIKDCAVHELRLPRPDRLGARIGRSGETVRRALSALHDNGQIILRQRGMRRVAELPDGRSTR